MTEVTETRLVWCIGVLFDDLPSEEDDKTDAWDHPVRERLGQILGEMPMASKETLQERVRCGYGTLDYHLAVLKKCDQIISFKVGRYKRYSRKTMNTSRLEAIGVLRGHKEFVLAKRVLEHPGVMQTELTAGLNMSRKCFGTYMGRMIKAGLVRKMKKGQYFTYHPEDLLVSLIELVTEGFESEDSEPPSQAQRSPVSSDSLDVSPAEAAESPLGKEDLS